MSCKTIAFSFNEMATLSKIVRTALNDCASEPWKMAPAALSLSVRLKVCATTEKKLQFRCLKVDERKVCKRVKRKKKGRECGK